MKTNTNPNQMTVDDMTDDNSLLYSRQIRFMIALESTFVIKKNITAFIKINSKAYVVLNNIKYIK